MKKIKLESKTGGNINGEKTEIQKGTHMGNIDLSMYIQCEFILSMFFLFLRFASPEKRNAQKHANRQLFYLLTCFLSFLFPFSNFILLVCLDFADMFGFPCFFHFFSFLFPTKRWSGEHKSGQFHDMQGSQVISHHITKQK